MNDQNDPRWTDLFGIDPGFTGDNTLDILHPGVTCTHCGMQQRGSASIGDAAVCHTDSPFPDCYRLVTVWHEPLGSRIPANYPTEEERHEPFDFNAIRFKTP